MLHDPARHDVRLDISRRRASPQDLMSPRRVIGVVPNIFFAARIAETARALGIAFEAVAPEAALERCRVLTPDLVVLDLAAGGDPIELVRALRNDPTAARTEIVAFYPHVDQPLREAAVQAGCDRVLARSAFTARLGGILGGEAGSAG